MLNVFRASLDLISQEAYNIKIVNSACAINNDRSAPEPSKKSKICDVLEKNWVGFAISRVTSGFSVVL